MPAGGSGGGARAGGTPAPEGRGGGRRGVWDIAWLLTGTQFRVYREQMRWLELLVIFGPKIDSLSVGTTRRTMTMLRNQDRPELLLIIGQAAMDDGRPRAGLERLIKEARSASTPAVWLVDGESINLGCKTMPLTEPLPSPRGLQIARESFEIIPDAFGGSDGFGRIQNTAPRAPLAARCVVFAADVDACAAGKAAGMRVVGLGQLDDYADVCFSDLDDPDWGCAFDDLYTPGSFWVNPPVPRTLNGMHCDPLTGRQVSYDPAGSASLITDPLDDLDDESAILADLDDPP